MTSKRLRKLRKEYSPRASRQRLRLTDKRIRKLERERVHSGKSFEAVYRRYQKKRIAHAVQHAAKKYSLTRSEAARLRKAAIKQHLPIKKVLIPTPKPGQMEFTGNWTEFRKKCKEYEKIQSEVGKEKKEFDVDASLILKASFGTLEYEGSLANFPHVTWRVQGDEIFGPAEKEPYWTMILGLVEGFIYYETRGEIDVFTRFEVVIATDASNLDPFK